MSNTTIIICDASAEQARSLAKTLTAYADAMCAAQPDYMLALLRGVRDVSYNTHHYGWVTCYAGEALIKLENGTAWKAVGRETAGNSAVLRRQGWIEFFPISNEDYQSAKAAEKAASDAATLAADEKIRRLASKRVADEKAALAIVAKYPAWGCMVTVDNKMQLALIHDAPRRGRVVTFFEVSSNFFVGKDVSKYCRVVATRSRIKAKF